MRPVNPDLPCEQRIETAHGKLCDAGCTVPGQPVMVDLPLPIAFKPGVWFLIPPA